MAPEKSTVGAKVSPNLEERIEDYQESEGFTNKSDAVRDLIETGLEEHDNPSKTVPLPVLLLWFGTLLIMIPAQPGPGTNPDFLIGAGVVVSLLAVALGRYDLLAKIRG